MNYIRYAAPDTEIKKGSNKKIIILEGKDLPDIQSVYDHLVTELEFPEYFGDNLDALYDMLTDLQWLSQRCFEFFIYDYDQLLKNEDIETKAELIAVLDDAIECWKEEVPADAEWDAKKLHVWLLGDPDKLKSEVALLDQYLVANEGEEE